MKDYYLFFCVHPFRRIHIYLYICVTLCFQPQRHIGKASPTSAVWAMWIKCLAQGHQPTAPTKTRTWDPTIHIPRLYRLLTGPTEGFCYSPVLWLSGLSVNHGFHQVILLVLQWVPIHSEIEYCRQSIHKSPTSSNILDRWTSPYSKTGRGLIITIIFMCINKIT